MANLPKILKTKIANHCPLDNGSLEAFNNLDLTSLPGSPKIWKGEKILIKSGPGGENNLLKNLLISSDLSKVLEGVSFEKISPIKVPLSGSYI